MHSNTIVTQNPATETELARYELFSPAQIEHKLSHAELAQSRWRKVEPAARCALFERLALVLEQRQLELARLITQEMGKPISQSRAEVSKAVFCCRFYAEKGPAWLADQPIATDARKSYVSFQPQGTVLAIMPWNFPLWQAVRALVPALCAGNSMLLKHSANTTGCALALERLLTEAGFPEFVFSTLLVDHQTVEKLLADRRIHCVTLTGSTSVGRRIAELAGRQLKKCVLELGGSDAHLVLADADVAQAAATCVGSRMLNTGQSCIAGKRFLVARSIYTEFIEFAAQELSRYQRLSPDHEQALMGPMARSDLRQELHAQVKLAQNQGARLLAGGELPLGPGFFYPPTMFVDVPSSSVAFRQELFGPVLCLTPFDYEDEGIELANDSEFGLGACVYSRDLERAELLARQKLLAGSCFVNHAVQSDPRLPFGGVKNSGYGRELSHFGLYEFANIKTVSVYSPS